MTSPEDQHPARRRFVPIALAACALLVVALVVVFATRDTPDGTASNTSPPAGSSAPEEPVEEPEGTAGIAQNILHADLRLDPTECALPELTLDAAGQEQFLVAAMTCLDETWLPVLEEQGIETQPIGLEVIAERTEGCGGDPVKPTDSAYYCPETGVVYWPAKDTNNDDWGAEDWMQYLFIAMHEYAHHVQMLTGVEDEAYEHEEEVGEKSPKRFEVSRRFELQAQCLAGMATASAEAGGTLTPAEAEEVLVTQAEVGDSDEQSEETAAPADTEETEGTGGERTHGDGESNEMWTYAGYEEGSTTACDTWSVEPADVS